MIFVEKKVHKLRIAGDEYRIVSDESTEYMQSLAHEVDLKAPIYLLLRRLFL